MTGVLLLSVGAALCSRPGLYSHAAWGGPIRHPQIVRRKKTTRAADLATLLGVSERTIYRDIGDMVSRGVRIDGEAGVGYIFTTTLRPGSHRLGSAPSQAPGEREHTAWG